MAAVLDDVGKSKVSKKIEEDVLEDGEQEEDVDNESTATKKRRKRRKKKAQTNGEYIIERPSSPLIFAVFIKLFMCCIQQMKQKPMKKM